MFRYVATAWILKLFSLNSATRRLYRLVGNRFGQNRRSMVSETVVRRGLWLVSAVQRYSAGLDETSVILELGTGWQHFYALFLRLFYSPQMILFDVQDNRQFASLQKRFVNLVEVLPGALPKEWTHRRADIEARLRQIISAASFEELYAQLGLTYRIEPSGRLDFLPDKQIDLVFSMDVLEHVDRAAMPVMAQAVRRVLRPGGLFLNQIGLDDHLAHYAPGVSPKHFLTYSHQTWGWLFENNLQSFNRLQLSDIVRIMEQAGLETLECVMDQDHAGLEKLRPHRQYQTYSRADLAAIRGYLICRAG